MASLANLANLARWPEAWSPQEAGYQAGTETRAALTLGSFLNSTRGLRCRPQVEPHLEWAWGDNGAGEVRMLVEGRPSGP